MPRPALTLGLRHLALNSYRLEEMVRFYETVVGMRIEWQPDVDNVYLTSGVDNLALHRVAAVPARDGALDHLGFILSSEEAVEAWHAYLYEQGVPIVKKPKKHRDGAMSFYCQDPDGNTVQFIYHPPLMQAS